MIIPVVIGLSILSIFLLFILLKRDKVLSDYHLIAVILFFKGILGSQILMEHWPSKAIYLIVIFFNTYYFPVLVIYGLILLDGKNTFNIKWLWVYLYPVVYTIFILSDVFGLNNYNSFQEIQALFNNPSPYQRLLYISHYIYVIVVLIWLWKKIRRYSDAIKNFHSTIEHIHLNWFRNFVGSFLGLSVFGFIVFGCFSLELIDDIQIPFGIEYGIFLLLLFYLCYHGIKQYSLADFNIDDVSSKAQVGKSPIKYQSSNLQQEKIDSYFMDITRLFDEEELFLQPQLKIEDISKRLDLTIHKVSQIINSKSNQSFLILLTDTG